MLRFPINSTTRGMGCIYRFMFIIIIILGAGSITFSYGQGHTIFSDTVTIDSVNSKKIVFTIEDTTMEFRACPDCLTQYIREPNDKFHIIAKLAIDSKGIVREFVCPMNKGWTAIHYDENGQIRFIEYINRKGKRKFIKDN